MGILAGVAAFGAACTQQGCEPPTAVGAAEASISEDELRNATYQGIYDAPVMLEDGEWEGEPFAPGGVSRPRLSLARDFLSLADLGGVEWVLTHFGWEDPAPPEPAITLVFEGERIAGSTGCNRYFAGVEAGKAPGELQIGTLGTTRVACAEDRMALEARYLEALGRVVRFAFVTGRLVLTWSRGSATGIMLFGPGRPGASSRS